MMSTETAVELLRAAVDSGQLRETMVEGRILEFLDTVEQTFVISQTETFRVRATSVEEAKQLVADNGSEHPNVEWLDSHREEA